MKLTLSEIRRLETSLKSVENGLTTLLEKKKRILKELGRTETSQDPTSVRIPSVGDEFGGGVVLGTYVKVNEYKKDGSLSKAVRYVELGNDK